MLLECFREVRGRMTDEQVVARHERYVRFGDTGNGRMNAVVLPDGAKVGSVGYSDAGGTTSGSTNWAGRSCPCT
ncbi:hypothetical protein E1193_03930 [Micromonospora sp. KC606]|uniref:hypothetical protein n=1 Tax=Micromonospora sp. KC606 TaxID=2530379 RepID=UPI00104AE102|nr:hypothetical protein [Micromonospora sp. KC606]TDC85065.1 hypothetical protein E1193_03930 [Micromonospora sp. KC606]